MATINLVRGMGSFFKECEHPGSRWPRCPHEYTIRYRNAAGQQTEESGFATQDKAKSRLAEIYQASKNNPQSQHKAARVQQYSPMDAHRRGLYDDNPLDGVKPPQYDPKRAVIPSPAQVRDIRTAGDDTFRLVTDLTSGCGMRNGEALAININIADDGVYRITEQVNQTTKAHTPSSTARPATTATSRSPPGSGTPSSGTRTPTAPSTATSSDTRAT